MAPNPNDSPAPHGHGDRPCDAGCQRREPADEIAGAIARALELRIAEAVEVLLHGCSCGAAPQGRHDRDCERHQCDEKAEGDGSGSRRPGSVVGTSRGDLDGSPLTKSDLHDHHPPNSWAGARKDSLLPMLFLRANPGDTGTRPVVGPFWESPDIYILAGVSPDDAPDLPPALGEIAQAGAENTVYAHVWNLGRAAADDVVVEFFWIDPSLGVDAGGCTRSVRPRPGWAHATVDTPTES